MGESVATDVTQVWNFDIMSNILESLYIPMQLNSGKCNHLVNFTVQDNKSVLVQVGFGCVVIMCD